MTIICYISCLSGLWAILPDHVSIILYCLFIVVGSLSVVLLVSNLFWLYLSYSWFLFVFSTVLLVYVLLILLSYGTISFVLLLPVCRFIVFSALIWWYYLYISLLAQLCPSFLIIGLSSKVLLYLVYTSCVLCFLSLSAIFVMHFCMICHCDLHCHVLWQCLASRIHHLHFGWLLSTLYGQK